MTAPTDDDVFSDIFCDFFSIVNSSLIDFFFFNKNTLRPVLKCKLTEWFLASPCVLRASLTILLWGVNQSSEQESSWSW